MARRGRDRAGWRAAAIGAAAIAVAVAVAAAALDRGDDAAEKVVAAPAAPPAAAPAPAAPAPVVSREQPGKGEPRPGPGALSPPSSPGPAAAAARCPLKPAICAALAARGGQNRPLPRRLLACLRHERRCAKFLAKQQHAQPAQPLDPADCTQVLSPQQCEALAAGHPPE